jgi:hypothetical protein
MATRAEDSSNHTGFTGGIEGGYNYVSGNWLLGLEADAGGAEHQVPGLACLHLGHHAADNPAAAADQLHAVLAGRHRLDDQSPAAYRLRLRTVAVLWHRRRRLGQGEVQSGILDTRTAGDAFVAEKKKTKPGWIAGLGFGYAFNPNWSVKGEWLYADFGKNHATGISPNGFVCLTSEAKVRTNIAAHRDRLQVRAAASAASPSASAASAAAASAAASPPPPPPAAV